MTRCHRSCIAARGRSATSCPFWKGQAHSRHSAAHALGDTRWAGANGPRSASTRAWRREGDARVLMLQFVVEILTDPLEHMCRDLLQVDCALLRTSESACSSSEVGAGSVARCAAAILAQSTAAWPTCRFPCAHGGSDHLQLVHFAILIERVAPSELTEFLIVLERHAAL